MTNDEFKELTIEYDKKSGIFNNEATEKTLLCIGICLSSDMYSRQTAEFLVNEIKKDQFFIVNILNNICLNIFTEVINEVLLEEFKEMNFEERLVKSYIIQIIEKLENKEKAIAYLFKIVINNIDFVVFYTNKADTDSQLTYQVTDVPTFFSFMIGNYLSKNGVNENTKIYKKQQTITNIDDFKKLISKIMKYAFRYYLFIVIDLQKLVKNI